MGDEILDPQHTVPSAVLWGGVISGAILVATTLAILLAVPQREIGVAHGLLERYLHSCFHVTPYESYVRLAERLNALTRGDFPKKTLLVNGGAEAVENAVKIARAYTRRPAVICFEDAFHGRTLLTLSLTSKTHPYKSGFEPFVSDVYRIPYAYCFRCAYSLEYPACRVFCAHHLEDTFKRVVAAESVAAVIVEPVLGEGGFVAPPPEFLPVLRDICGRHGILFIADEVQTGFGRTGSLFACDRYAVEPDLLVTAKSLGGGLALGAITGRAEIMDAPAVGALGGTFGGNPLACEAALAVLEMFDAAPGGNKSAHDPVDLVARANWVGERSRARARDWQARWPLIGDVRGVGAMQAIELVRAPGSRQPAEVETEAVVRQCYEHGPIVLSAGTYANVIRLLVPLVITGEQFEEGFAAIERALESVCESKSRRKPPCALESAFPLSASAQVNRYGIRGAKHVCPQGELCGLDPGGGWETLYRSDSAVLFTSLTKDRRGRSSLTPFRREAGLSDCGASVAFGTLVGIQPCSLDGMAANWVTRSACDGGDSA